MIFGEINPNGEASVRIQILDSDGIEIDISTVIDTEFDGMLTLPSSLADMLGAVSESQGAGLLANGMVCQYDLFEVTILWEGVRRKIIAPALGEVPLIGMPLLAGHELRMQVIPQGPVEIFKI